MKHRSIADIKSANGTITKRDMPIIEAAFQRTSKRWNAPDPKPQIWHIMDFDAVVKNPDSNKPFHYDWRYYVTRCGRLMDSSLDMWKRGTDFTDAKLCPHCGNLSAFQQVELDHRAALKARDQEYDRKREQEKLERIAAHELRVKTVIDTLHFYGLANAREDNDGDVIFNHNIDRQIKTFVVTMKEPK